MNKKTIGIILCLIIFSVLSFILYSDRTTSIITLDINPSVRIELNKDNKVKRVVALNKDAKKVIKNIDKTSIKSTIESITKNTIDEIDIKEEHIIILINTEGNISCDDLKHDVEISLSSQNIDVELMIMNEISKEDKELAKQLNITPAKASYINSIKEKYESIDETTLGDKSIKELTDIKETGRTCPDSYTLYGDQCKKELKKEDAVIGLQCPDSYYEETGYCIQEASRITTGLTTCNSDGVIENGRCKITRWREADDNFTCSVGTKVTRSRAQYRDVRDNGNPNEMLCEDTSNAVKPTLRCLIGPHIMMGGKCYVGPAPLINGGCPGNDVPVDGGCYSLDPEDQWQCPNGDIYEYSKDSMVELCPDTFSYTLASGSYTCNSDETLQGDRCIKIEYEDVIIESVCPEGYTDLEGGRCVNYNNKIEATPGKICEGEDYVLEGDYCIVYDTIEPIQN